MQNADKAKTNLQQKSVEPLLTVDEVCRLLQVKRSTVYSWVQSGRLACVRLGRVLRFHSDSIGRVWTEGLRQSRKEKND